MISGPRFLRLFAASPVSLVLAAGMAGATAAPPPASFAAPELYPAGRFPVAIATGDVTGDAKTDLVVVNQKSKNVSVLAGDGSGRFELEGTPSVQNKPSGVAVADLDGDNHLDISVANQGSGTVSLLYGSGGGGFTTATVNAGTGPAAVMIGDFNADQKPDLAVANAGDGTVEVLLHGQGSREFVSAGPATLVGSTPSSLAGGDFNNDDKLDLVVANRGGDTLSVLLGDGAGGFTDSYPPITVGKMPTAVAAKDLSGDGNPDVVATVEARNSGAANTVVVLLGHGNGTFTVTRLAGKTSAHPTSVAIGDLNGDGDLDIVAGSGDSAQASIYYGDGQGHFGRDPDHTDGKARLIAAGRAPIAVATDNLDGDTQLDLAFADSFLNGVTVVLGDGGGGLVQPRTIGTGSQPVAAALGDLNGDGTLDAVTANRNAATVSVLRGLGDGSFTAFSSDVAVGTSPNDVALEDLDLDGNRDLAVANLDSNTVSLLRGDGGGNFSRFPCQAGDLLVGLAPHGVAIADLNGDQRPDLVTANTGSNDVTVLLNQGGGCFTAAAGSPFVAGQGPVSVAIADITNDGLLDVVVADFGLSNDPSGKIALLRGHGDGSFDTLAAFSNVGKRPSSVTAGDLNGDLVPDVVVTNRHDSSVSVLVAGGGGLTPATTFPLAVGYSPVAVAIKDFNRDGFPDLAVAESGGSPDSDDDYCKVRGGLSGGVSIVLGDGTGTFMPGRSYASLNDACDIVVGDLNNDLKPDIVVPAARTRVAEAYLNETP